MAADLRFACRCGEVAGRLREVSPACGLRYVCHCDDCQAFARSLGREDLLDAHGGSDAFQTDSSRLVIERGRDCLATLRVADIKLRPTLRWYAACCGTPLFSTGDRAQRSFLSFLLANARPEDRDAAGASIGHVWLKYARGDRRDLRAANLWRIVGRMLRRQVTARLTGDFRNTPLFNQAGDPIAKPRVLSAEERQAAEVVWRGDAARR